MNLNVGCPEGTILYLLELIDAPADFIQCHSVYLAVVAVTPRGINHKSTIIVTHAIPPPTSSVSHPS